MGMSGMNAAFQDERYKGGEKLSHLKAGVPRMGWVDGWWVKKKERNKEQIQEQKLDEKNNKKKNNKTPKNMKKNKRRTKREEHKEQ